MYREVFVLKRSAVVHEVIGYIDVHIRVGEVLVFVTFVSVALRSGTLGRSGQSQFGQFGLLLLQTLFAPLDASVLEPDFDLERDGEKKYLEGCQHGFYFTL